MRANIELRYDIRLSEVGDHWTVYDIFTGEPVVLDSIKMTMLDLEAATDLVDLLNTLNIERREATIQ